MALRTGNQYLAGLRDGRRVVYDGRLIGDVTAAPVFRRQAAAIAQFYDFQNLAEVRDLMSFETEDGDRAPMAFLEPRSKEDLRRRAASYAAWAEVTCGLQSRSPDYMNTMLTALAGCAAACHDQEIGKPVRDLYLRARSEDRYWTHTFVYPFKDHSKPLHENPTVVRVVRETSDAIVVSGARGLATGAPFADYNLNFEPLRRLGSMGAGDPTAELLSLAFTHEVANPGVRWVCRDIEDTERSRFDAPLSAVADELDAVAVFEEAVIPRENILSYARDYAAAARLAELWGPFAEEMTKHQSLVRSIAKTRFLLGLAHLMAESSQASKFVNVQQRLGDIVLCLDLLESVAVAAIEDPEQDPVSGWYRPKAKYASAGARLFGESYPRLLDHLLMIGASRLVCAPQERTLEVLGEAIEPYFRGSDPSAKGSVGLYRMAWDLAGTRFGRRQDLYERFFANSYEIQKVNGYLRMDKREVIAMVKRMLDGASSAQPFPLPDRYR